VSRELEGLRAGYDALWRHRDFDTAFGALPDDFESRSEFGLDFDSRGPEEFARRFRDWFELWDQLDSSYELEDLGGGRVLVDVVTRGRGQASGVEAEMKFTQVWRFEDGVARDVVWYESREQALADLRAQ
jgi:hypothetical protein